MRSVILAMVSAGLAVSSASATDALYRCSAKTVLTTKDDGTLGPYENSFWTDYWTNVLVDTATGVLRYGTAKPEQMVIVQRGSGTDDFVATPRNTPVSASMEVLRVRAWDGKPMVTFYAFSLSTVVTGTCTIVR